jgi:TRAP-type uncharacterized transport system substrate-binding protein
VQQQRPVHAPPVVTRSKLLLEVTSEIIGDRAFGPQQARLQLRRQGAANPWELSLFASDAPSIFDDVARGEAQIGMINPSDVLTLAYRGTGPFKEPLPVRAITVIPSYDAFLFAISERTRLTSLADLRDQRYPLKIAMRAQPDHSDYLYVNTVLGALGFSLDDIVSWGGAIVPMSFPPPDAAAVESGAIDAIFDEAIGVWTRFALEHKMRLLPLDEPLLQKLEAIGLRRVRMTQEIDERLPADLDIPTLDFSGWPVFTLADVPDDFIRRFCVALEARKDRIPWQGDGPLPLEQMCIGTKEAPLAVPLHPAAEQFWRERGYL